MECYHYSYPIEISNEYYEKSDALLPFQQEEYALAPPWLAG
mgnify:CR=1 FL=1